MFEIGAITVSWRDLLDIVLVAFLLYRLMLLIRGTRAVSVILGLILLLLVYFVSEELGLYALNWLLANFLGSIFLVVIILFQQDIRKALSEVGTGRLWRRGTVREDVLDELVAALEALAKRNIGALVIIEKRIPLGDIVERGVRLDARFSAPLLMTIFHPNTPLHDGAVILRSDQIVAAACILPLSTAVKHHSDLGTRHRAALGMTEESDAVALIVSEERGVVSLAVGGRLTAGLDDIRLKRVLKKALEK